MDSELECCVGVLEGAGIASGEELSLWRGVFAKTGVTYEDVSMASAYLALVRVDKRKECFQVLGFSPEVGALSKWAANNGFEPAARFMSWKSNKELGFPYGQENFLVMVPEVIRGRQCGHLCQFFHLSCRVGPVRMASLILPKLKPVVMVTDSVPEKKVVDVVDVKQESLLLKDKVPDVVRVEPVVETVEEMSASAYLLVFKPEVRERVFDELGLKPTLKEVLSAEYPMEDIGKLKDLRFSLHFRESQDFGVFKIGRHRVKEDLCEFLQVLQYVGGSYDDVVKVRLKCDGVDYRDCGCSSVPVFEGERDFWRIIKYEEPLVDALDGDEKSNGFNVQIGGHVCAKYGFVHAVVDGLQDKVVKLLGFSSGMERLLSLVRGRFVDWACECPDRRSSSEPRAVVFVRFMGVGVDREIDAVWYGLESDGIGPGFSWIKSFRMGSGALDRSTYGLVSCVQVGIGDVPTVVKQGVEYSANGYSFVKFSFDTSDLVGGLGNWEFDETGEPVYLCVCGLTHE